MAVGFKIDAVARISEIDVRGDLALPEQKQAIADFVGGEIEEAKVTNARILGRVPPYTVTVDGREGARLESVNPDGGTIIVEFELIGGVLQWIGQTLIDRSPHVSGEYKRSHTLYADGQEVPLGGVTPFASEYVFLNLVPYTRKIEIGKTKKGRDFLVQVENRIYERTAEDAARRFGNQARVKFGYHSPIGTTSIGKWAASPSAQALAHRSGRRTNKTQWLTRVPAILVYQAGS